MLSYRSRIMQSSRDGARDRSALFDIVDNHLKLGDQKPGTAYFCHFPSVMRAKFEKFRQKAAENRPFSFKARRETSYAKRAFGPPERPFAESP